MNDGCDRCQWWKRHDIVNDNVHLFPVPRCVFSDAFNIIFSLLLLLLLLSSFFPFLFLFASSFSRVSNSLIIIICDQRFSLLAWHIFLGIAARCGSLLLLLFINFQCGILIKIYWKDMFEIEYLFGGVFGIFCIQYTIPTMALGKLSILFGQAGTRNGLWSNRLCVNDFSVVFFPLRFASVVLPVIYSTDNYIQPHFAKNASRI